MQRLSLVQQLHPPIDAVLQFNTNASFGKGSDLGKIGMDLTPIDDWVERPPSPSPGGSNEQTHLFSNEGEELFNFFGSQKVSGTNTRIHCPHSFSKRFVNIPVPRSQIPDMVGGSIFRNHRSARSEGASK
jgi:hypothetical protein